MALTAARPTPATAAAPPARRRRRRPKTPYLLIAPTVLLLTGLLAYPMGTVVYYSLQRYNLTRPWANGFAGLDNLRHMLTDDPVFWQSLRFSVSWVGVEVGLQLLFGLGLALIVNETFLGRSLARSMVFSPWAVSGVLTTGIWILLYSPSTGVFRLLSDLGVGSGNTSVLGNPSTVFSAVVVAELWRGVPFFAILLLAGLQTIPADLYEAAHVDGANRWRRFVHVTLPHLRDTIVLATLLRAVWEFNNVDLIYTLTGGGPAHQTTTLPVYIARTAVDSHDFGYGSALTMAGFAVLLFFSVLYLRLSKFGADR